MTNPIGEALMQVMFKLFVLIMMSLTAQFALASESAGEQNEARHVPLPPAYPGWPDRPVQKETVPAPPAGPYMSTGLSDGRRGFGCCNKRNVNRMTSAPMLNNMPWSERRYPPQQWRPQGGYNYAPGNFGNAGSVPPPRSVPSQQYRGAPMYAQPPMWQPMRQPMQQPMR